MRGSTTEHPEPLTAGSQQDGLDPRMRARSDAVQRTRARHRRRLAAGVLAAIAALAGVVLLRNSPLFDLDRIVVEGEARTAERLVVEASGLQTGSPLAEVAPSRVEAAVERLPWVGVAEVERRWPSTVRVRVTERSPVAAVPARSGRDRPVALVDAEGRVLDVVDQRPPTLPVLAQVPAPEVGALLAPEAAEALAVASGLPEGLRGAVIQVERTGRGLEVRLPGGTVWMGSSDDLGAKLAATETVLERVDPPAAGWVLDVRVSRSPVLTSALVDQ